MGFGPIQFFLMDGSIIPLGWSVETHKFSGLKVFEVVAKKLRARKRSARNCVMYVMLGDIKAFECEMSLKK